jgi:hypothetical protein
MWILGAKSTMVTIPRRRFQRVLGFRPPGAAEAGNEDSLGPAGTRASNGPNGSGPDEVRSEENAICVISVASELCSRSQARVCGMVCNSDSPREHRCHRSALAPPC